MSTTRSLSPTAPATDRRDCGDALLLCAHGSRDSLRSLNRRAHALAELEDFADIQGCTLHGSPGLEETVRAIDGERIFLVPFLMARGYSYELLRRRLAALQEARPVVLCEPVGTHPDMARGIAQSAENWLSEQAWKPRESALLLVGHGTPRNSASRTGLQDLVTHLAATGQFGEVDYAMLEEAPGVGEAMAGLRSDRVLAVGCFIEAGQHGAGDVPELIARADRPVGYLGPIGLEPWIDRIVLSCARSATDRLVA